MGVTIYCVFFAIMAKYFTSQANAVNVTENNIESNVSSTTAASRSTKRIFVDVNKTNIENDSSDFDKNVTIPWDSFYDILTSLSLFQLQQIKNNIKKHYNLNEIEGINVDKVFTDSGSEYELLLKYKLKQIEQEKKFNDSEAFMFHFIDISNFVIEKIIEYNLDKVNKGLLKTYTNWNKQTLKDKIFRQQLKTVNTLIEMQICNRLAICKEREYYSEYIIEWLRCLINLKDNVIKEVFNAVPVVVDNYSEFIHNNALFKKNMQYASKINVSAQRDILDFIDETITNENIFTLIPNALKKCVALLVELFNAINSVYVINEKNYEELESISYKLLSQNGNGAEIKYVLDAIVRNMQMNFKLWPKEEQGKIRQLWLKITLL